MMTRDLVPRLARGERVFPAFPDIAGGGFDRLFDELWGSLQASRARRAHGFAPRVDIDETAEEIRLSVELPGLRDGDFEVLLDADVLTIKGERKDEREEKSEGYQRVETQRGSFQRSFRLPFEADPEAVKAGYRNGILEVTVAKPAAEQPKSRTIPVTAA